MTPDLLRSLRNGFIIGACLADIAYSVSAIISAHRRDKKWTDAVARDVEKVAETSGD